MRNLKIVSIFLLIISTAVMCYCWFFSSGIAPEGLFILESSGGMEFELMSNHLERAKNLYTEMEFDTSMLEKGLMMITASPYEAVKSYRRVEEAAEVLNLSDYALYEAGLVPESIEKKAMLALWCLFVYVLVCAGFLLFGFLRRRINREYSLSKHMYANEFFKKRWKQIFSMAALSLVYIGVAAMPWTIMAITPLLPMTSENIGIRLWDGLTGMGLLPETSPIQFNVVLEKLWKVNLAANLGLVVFLAALVFVTLVTYRPSKFTRGLRV